MQSIVLRLKVAAQSLKVVDEQLQSMPDTLSDYDKAQAAYIVSELKKLKQGMISGPCSSALKKAITEVAKEIEERS